MRDAASPAVEATDVRVARVDARSELWAFVELLALSGFAIAQPLLDVFGDAPEVFVFHRARARDIVAFAAIVVVLPPLVLWAVGLTIGTLTGRRGRELVHRLSLGGLAGILTIQVVRTQTLSGVLLALVALVVALSAFLLVRRRGMQLWMRFAGLAPVAFAALFLVSSPVAPLVTDGSGPDAVAIGTVRETPVVVLVFDELPTASLLDGDGQIDRDRFPSFARLADDGTWFRNATAVADYTDRAVPAALTGRYPAMTQQAQTWRNHPDNLFRLLGGAYDMHVIESLTLLCPPTVCDDGHDGRGAKETTSRDAGGLSAVLSDARRVFGDLVALEARDRNPVASLTEELARVDGPTPAELPGSDVEPGLFAWDFDGARRVQAQPRRFLDLVGSLHTRAPGQAPGFWFLHVALPHNPFRMVPGAEYEPGGDASSLPGLSPTLRWSDDPWPALAARQRHLLQASAVDAHLGTVLDELERLGIYDEALVVVTADHGASFRPGTSFRTLSEENAAEIAWVPFLVKRPQEPAPGVVDDRNVETIDLLPTVADVLDVEVPWAIDGRSAFGPARTTTTKVFRNAEVFPRSDDDYDEVLLDARTGFEEMLASALPGRHPGDEVVRGILATGERGAHVGRPVTDYARAPAGGGRAVVDDLGALRDVDLAAPLPLFVRGRLADHDPPPGDAPIVALTVNGRLAGTSSVFADGDEPARFTMLVPPDLLREGRNDVAAYLLRTGAGRDALAPIGLDAS